VRGRIGNPQRLNRYAYVVGDPTNRFDPRGTDDSWTGGAGACFGGECLMISVDNIGTPADEAEAAIYASLHFPTTQSLMEEFLANPGLSCGLPGEPHPAGCEGSTGGFGGSSGPETFGLPFAQEPQAPPRCVQKGLDAFVSCAWKVGFVCGVAAVVVVGVCAATGPAFGVCIGTMGLKVAGVCAGTLVTVCGGAFEIAYGKCEMYRRNPQTQR
jgi:hypothetical protein